MPRGIFKIWACFSKLRKWTEYINDKNGISQIQLKYLLILFKIIWKSFSCQFFLCRQKYFFKCLKIILWNSDLEKTIVLSDFRMSNFLKYQLKYLCFLISLYKCVYIFVYMYACVCVCMHTGDQAEHVTAYKHE